MEQAVILHQPFFSQNIQTDLIGSLIDSMRNDVTVCQINVKLIDILPINSLILSLHPRIDWKSLCHTLGSAECRS